MNLLNPFIHNCVQLKWKDRVPSSCTRWRGSAAGTLCSRVCRNVPCRWGTDTQSTPCTRTAWGLWRRRPPRSDPARLQREARRDTRGDIHDVTTDFIHRTTRWTVSRMFDLSSNFIFNVYWYSAFHEHQNKQWWDTFGQVRHHLITLYTWTDFFLQFLQMFNMKLNLPTWFSGRSGDYLPKIKSDINDWLLLLLLSSTVK